MLAYAVIVSAWATDSVHRQPCTGIEVELLPAEDGAPEFLDPDAVLRELGLLATNYSKYSLYDINTDSLERHLNRVNNFEHVEVVRTSLGKLLVRVKPIVPELRVFTPTETYYINKDGKRMDAHAEYFVDLPVVYGRFTRKMPPTGVLPVSRYIRGDSLLRNLVTMIEYRDPQNIILVPRIRGHVINIGDTANLPDKFSRLLTMYRKVMPHQGWAKYDTISVKFKGQIVATRADKSIVRHNDVNLDEIEDYEELSVSDQTRTVTGSETEADLVPVVTPLESPTPQE